DRFGADEKDAEADRQGRIQVVERDREAELEPREQDQRVSVIHDGPPDCRLRTTDYFGLRASGSGLRAPACERWALGSGLWALAFVNYFTIKKSAATGDISPAV